MISAGVNVMELVAHKVISATEARSMKMSEVKRLYFLWATLETKGVL